MNRNVLRSPWQFRLVYQTGKKINCKYAVLFYHKTDEPNDGPLFGFVASKKVGGAVSRNRAKRLLREAIRDTAYRFKSGDLWVVLVAKRSILDATFGELAEDLQNALVGVGLIRGGASS